MTNNIRSGVFYVGASLIVKEYYEGCGPARRRNGNFRRKERSIYIPADLYSNYVNIHPFNIKKGSGNDIYSEGLYFISINTGQDRILGLIITHPSQIPLLRYVPFSYVHYTVILEDLFPSCYYFASSSSGSFYVQNINWFDNTLSNITNLFGRRFYISVRNPTPGRCYSCGRNNRRLTSIETVLNNHGVCRFLAGSDNNIQIFMTLNILEFRLGIFDETCTISHLPSDVINNITLIML